MEQSAKLIYQVNKIIQMHLDRALGYQKAMSLVDDSDLSILFERCMQQSYYFVDKLQAAMALHGMETRARPSWTGTVYRAWMSLRTAASSNKYHSVLYSCMAAEKMMNLSYELLCSNKYLQYYFPLLKFTFLKQHFGLKKIREDLEAILRCSKQDMGERREADTGFPVVNKFPKEASVS